MKLIGLKKIHQGKYLSYYNAIYENDNKEEKIYEFVSRNNNLKDLNHFDFKPLSICMVIKSQKEDCILLEKEFRLSINDFCYNLPQGLIDDGETICEASKRELEEETGLLLTDISKVYPPSLTEEGITSDTLCMVYGHAKGKIIHTNHSNEDISAVWVNKEEASSLLKENYIMSVRVQLALIDFIK